MHFIEEMGFELEAFEPLCLGQSFSTLVVKQILKYLV